MEYGTEALMAAFRGALMLDMLKPGWTPEFPEDIDVSNPCVCPLGWAFQAEGDADGTSGYWAAMEPLGLHTDFHADLTGEQYYRNRKTLIQFGFLGTWGDGPDSDELNAAWRGLLTTS